MSMVRQMDLLCTDSLKTIHQQMMMASISLNFCNFLNVSHRIEGSSKEFIEKYRFKSIEIETFSSLLKYFIH